MRAQFVDTVHASFDFVQVCNNVCLCLAVGIATLPACPRHHHHWLHVLPQTSAAAICGYVFMAMFAARFAAVNPQSNGGLLATATNAAAVGAALTVSKKIVNPMLGGGTDNKESPD